MIAFTSFPVPSDSTGYSTNRHHPDAEADISMDEDFEAGGSKITYPGESLMSAQSFMRYVSCTNLEAFIDSEIQWAWDICRKRRSNLLGSRNCRTSQQTHHRQTRSHQASNADLSDESLTDMTDILQIQCRSGGSCRWADHRGMHLSRQSRDLFLKSIRFSPADGRWMQTPDKMLYWCCHLLIYREGCR